MIEWHAAFPSRIRVFLVPTTTFHSCSHNNDLYKVAMKLNKAQRVYEFIVPLPSPSKHLPRVSRGGFDLQRKVALSYKDGRDKTSKSSEEHDLSIHTYRTIDDVSDQTLLYTFDVVKSFTGRPLVQDDIVVLLCGEVVVRSVIDYEFEKDAALDSYSLISVLAFEESPKTENSVDICDYNNNIKPNQQVGVISLRRLPLIFPEINYTDIPQRAKNIVSRYMITNIVTFVANRTFAVCLSHHDMTGCLNETNWVGGERESYYADGFCQHCLNDYEHYQVAERYSRFSVKNVVDAVGSMTKVIDRFDETLRSAEKAALWINVALVAVSLNIVDAIFVDFAWRDHEILELPTWIPSWLVIKPHWPASLLAVIVALIGGGHLVRYFQRRRELP